MIRRIDLNADLGEGVTDDEALLAVVTSANVACGFHAGDEATMRAVCVRAAALGVAVGAQVSYEDRAGFGRRDLDVAPGVLEGQVAEQVEVLSVIAVEVGTRVSYVKPHGALYNRVVHDAEHAAAVLRGSHDLPVLGLPGSVLLELARDLGRETRREGFPDRAYTPEGRLLPRSEPGAVLSDAEEIARRAVELAAAVESVCVHGDEPGAVRHAQAVRAALEESGFELGPLP